MYRISDAMWDALKHFIVCYQTGISEDSSIALMQFLRSLRSAHEQENSHSLSKYITKSVEYIECNLKQGIGIVDIAEHTGLSESHLRMLFRKEMGVSLGHYIAQKRLDTAKYRLLHSNMKLSDIAAECGFSNIFVFSAFFKKQIGTSPLRYRKKYFSISP